MLKRFLVVLAFSWTFSSTALAFTPVCLDANGTPMAQCPSYVPRTPRSVCTVNESPDGTYNYGCTTFNQDSSTGVSCGGASRQRVCYRPGMCDLVTTGFGTGYVLCSPAHRSYFSPEVRYVTQVNFLRTSAHLPPLHLWDEQNACVAAESAYDAARKTFHAAWNSGQKCGASAQNASMNWSIDSIIKDNIQDMWNEGPGGGHHDTMVSTAYTRIAVGFAQNADGSWWANADFYP